MEFELDITYSTYFPTIRDEGLTVHSFNAALSEFAFKLENAGFTKEAEDLKNVQLGADIQKLDWVLEHTTEKEENFMTGCYRLKSENLDNLKNVIVNLTKSQEEEWDLRQDGKLYSSSWRDNTGISEENREFHVNFQEAIEAQKLENKMEILLKSEQFAKEHAFQK